jgi:hypothetical protein
MRSLKKLWRKRKWRLFIIIPVVPLYFICLILIHLLDTVLFVIQLIVNGKKHAEHYVN